jgi:pyocin large subunit-like protein
MSPDRRRTRSGIPVAVLIAIITAIFGVMRSRQNAPVPASAGNRAPPAATNGTPAPNSSPPSASTASRGDSPGFTSRQHLVEHFEKHGAEFPGLDMAAYLTAAQTLRDEPAGANVLELRRDDGVVTRFDKSSGAFLAVNRDGTIRTFFRPNDGEAYFRRQATRSHGGGP